MPLSKANQVAYMRAYRKRNSSVIPDVIPKLPIISQSTIHNDSNRYNVIPNSNLTEDGRGALAKQHGIDPLPYERNEPYRPDVKPISPLLRQPFSSNPLRLQAQGLHM